MRWTRGSPPNDLTFSVGESANLLIEKLHGEVQKVNVQLPMPKSQKHPVTAPQAVTTERLSDEIGLLRVAMFPGAIGIDVAKDIDRGIAALDGCSRLIVDLRGNTGGGIGGLRLMSYLTPGKLEVGYSLTRKRRERGYRREELTRFGRIPSHKATLIWLAARYAFVEKSILVVTEGLGQQRFHGRVVLLVNEHTASAGEMVSTSVDAFSLLKDVVIPVTYTGYITASWRDRHESDLSGSDLERFRGSVIVSAGGGMDSYNMLATCIDTWEELQREGFDNRLMVLCLGAFLPQEQVDVLLTKVQRTPNIRAFRFPSTFRQLLSVADLSISCAGYNTCVDVMQARIRAIFIPSLSVSDQKRRAIRLQELGFGLAMSARTLQVADLKRAILDSLEGARPEVSLSLAGAECMKACVKRMFVTE
jgi:hypothetical protein